MGLIPLGLIGGAILRAGGRLIAGQAGRLLGRGATRSAAGAAAKAAVRVLPGAGIKRVIGAGAGIAAGVAAEKIIGGPGGASRAPVTVGNVNLNPWANTGPAARRKYRRINPLNPKALKRSIKRLSMFGDFAKQMGYTRPPKCIKGFKPATRRRKSCR